MVCFILCNFNCLRKYYYHTRIVFFFFKDSSTAQQPKRDIGTEALRTRKLNLRLEPKIILNRVCVNVAEKPKKREKYASIIIFQSIFCLIIFALVALAFAFYFLE